MGLREQPPLVIRYRVEHQPANASHVRVGRRDRANRGFDPINAAFRFRHHRAEQPGVVLVATEPLLVVDERDLRLGACAFYCEEIPPRSLELTNIGHSACAIHGRSEEEEREQRKGRAREPQPAVSRALGARLRETLPRGIFENFEVGCVPAPLAPIVVSERRRPARGTTRQARQAFAVAALAFAFISCL